MFNLTDCYYNIFIISTFQSYVHLDREQCFCLLMIDLQYASVQIDLLTFVCMCF